MSAWITAASYIGTPIIGACGGVIIMAAAAVGGQADRIASLDDHRRDDAEELGQMFDEKA